MIATHRWKNDLSDEEKWKTKMTNPFKSRRFATISVTFLTIVVLLFIFWQYYLTYPASYIWVMNSGSTLNQSFLVKMCPNGKRLKELQFGLSGQLGYDPNQDVIWAPELNDLDNIHYDQIVKVDIEGNPIDRIQGYRTGLLVVDPNDGSIWVPIQPPNREEGGVAKLAPNGKFLFAKVGLSIRGIYTLALDPRDGSLWIGGHRKLIHLSEDGEILFETSEVSFFSNGPHQIAVNPIHGDVWYTSGFRGQIIHMAADGNILTRVVIVGRDPIAIAIHPQDGGVWVANYESLGSGSVIKLNQDGEILLDLSTVSHAHSVGINPYDGTVWVGVEGGIILLDKNGTFIDLLRGFDTPVSFAFGQSRNILETIIECEIK